MAKVRRTGPKQFAAPDPDTDWLFHSLADGRIELVLTYSRERQEITDITLYCLGRPRNKANQIPVWARSIRFERDGSYVVHFNAPRAAAPRQVEPELPPTRLPPPSPGQPVQGKESYYPPAYPAPVVPR